MNKFSKSELISLFVIFLILISISIPNFVISLRRARDQVRRDDMGSIVHALNQYVSDFGWLPQSTTDGRIINCLKNGEKPAKAKNGSLIVNYIPCDWGKDAFSDPIDGNTYISILPQDPDFQKGTKYLYFSDGVRYQVYGAMEGMDEAEVDPKIIARGIHCGNVICNVGRSYHVPTDISIEEYDAQLQMTTQAK